MHGGELLSGEQNVRIVLAEIGPPQIDGMLEHSARLAQITGIGEGLRTLPGGEERGRLGHAGHAARIGRRTPVRTVLLSGYVRSGGGVGGWWRGVYISLLCGPPGSRNAGV
ncbi:hypothetical protein GCM10020358_59140 [Amorphoplanes nipponensis]|uniref:Uncharacterized protein n=1 Tax=Actinoplanes nipponensis TaxID=135950 RepID=A0A919MLZ8_9ACTN|nr:hypothetical protein Ani05nite_04270 [Actinoplanes nipponensis]